MSKPVVQNAFAGIDMGAEELVLLLRKPAKHSGITICLEATGTYSLELAVALSDAGLRVMAVTPQSSQSAPAIRRAEHYPR